MPSRKRHPNSRFPPSHIKRMMQQDEDIGKMAQAVPAMLARALELFSSMLVQQAGTVTEERNAKTLTQEHVVVAIKEDTRLDFLLPLVEGMGGERKKKGDVKDTTLAGTVKSRHTDADYPEVKKRTKKIVKSNNCKPGKPAVSASITATTSSDLTQHKSDRYSKEEKDTSKSGKLSSKSATSPSFASLSGQFSIKQLSPDQNNFVVSEVPSRTTLAHNVEVDEDYDD
eukprot:GFUD01024131.1.p1 GENE.GFUD01024131.1~~GFUD01024131.1.p1  ORF type:complete len:227 (-),score=72.79 GFUD01024131.1:51-731(-)